jgi:hypothetical protein
VFSRIKTCPVSILVVIVHARPVVSCQLYLPGNPTRIRNKAYSVDVVVGSLVSLDGNTWSDVGEQGEGPSEGQVEGNVTFTDGSSEGTLESNGVLLDRVDGVLWDRAFTVDNGRGNVDFLPLDGNLGSVILAQTGFLP